MTGGSPISEEFVAQSTLTQHVHAVIQLGRLVLRLLDC